MRFAVPVIFDDTVGGFGENLVALGTSYGLTRAQAQDTLHQTLSETADYAARVEALDHVPAERRQRLAGIVRRERAVLGT